MSLSKYLCLLFVLFACVTTASESEKNNPLKEIYGVYWTVYEEFTDAQFTKGFMFINEKELTGYDGCNSFGTSYTYSSESGFEIGDIISTQLACLDQSKPFFPPLVDTKSFEIKGSQLILHLKSGDKVVYYSAGLKSLKNHPLTQNDWILQSSNHPYFNVVRKENRLPLLRFMDNGNFIMNYNDDKSDLKAKNYMSGICNLGEKKILLKYYGTSQTMSMPKAEDARLAESVINAQNYHFKEGQLVLRNQNHYFVFEAK